MEEFPPNNSHKRKVIIAIVVGVVVLAVLGAAVIAAAYIYFRPAPMGARPLIHAGTIAGGGGEIGEPFGVAVVGKTVYMSDGDAGKILTLDASGKPATFAEGLRTPSAIAAAENGDLVVADTGSNTIRRIGPDKKAVIIAGSEGRVGSRDGAATEAEFNAPIGVAVGPEGRIFVADTYNDRIRVIENGRVRTLAGSTRGFADGIGEQTRFDTPCGIAVWQDKLLVADTGNHRIRVVEPDGRVWTLAGSGAADVTDGLLGEAAVYLPSAIAVDPAGVIYIADGNAIRIIGGDAFGFVRTISGTGRGLRDGNILRSRLNRPSGLAVDAGGGLIVADSENRVIRHLSPENNDPETTPDQARSLLEKPEQFRTLQPARWPYDPPAAKRDIAGTLGELRGEIRPGDNDIHFHNGLDIAGAYGETARFVREETVLRPLAAENFGTLRELIRMPTMGYIHIRLGRNVAGTPLGDPRFQFSTDPMGKLTDVRIPRGSHFKAGEPIGTLNPMNHVHLIAGRSGSEMNAMDALVFPGIADSRPPTIEKATLEDETRHPLETKGPGGRIELRSKTRIIVRAYDQVDGNADRRRLGVYKVGYQVLKRDGTPVGEPDWTIKFDRLPPAAAVPFVYAEGSHSGATGETIFRYIATNRVDGDEYKEDYFDPAATGAGEYVLRVIVADYFGNTTTNDTSIVIP